MIQATQLFDITIDTDIKFASDGESVEYTKSVIPYVSRNFILATPSQYIYHLKAVKRLSRTWVWNIMGYFHRHLNPHIPSLHRFSHKRACKQKQDETSIRLPSAPTALASVRSALPC